MGHKPFYVGTEAIMKAGILTLRSPIEGGRIVNWRNMEDVWRHALSKNLRASPQGHPILISETDHYTYQGRAETAQVVFESLYAPSLYIASQAALSLYATGRTTGAVLHSSESSTDAVPIYEGLPLHHAIKHLDITGRDLTERLREVISEKGFYIYSAFERRLLPEMKKKSFQVALDTEANGGIPTSADEVSYELPDNETITIREEGLQIPEALFNPSSVSLQQDGVPELVMNSIRRCDTNIQDQLYNNIVLVCTQASPAKCTQHRLKSSLSPVAIR